MIQKCSAGIALRRRILIGKSSPYDTKMLRWDCFAAQGFNGKSSLYDTKMLRGDCFAALGFNEKSLSFMYKEPRRMRIRERLVVCILPKNQSEISSIPEMSEPIIME